MKWGVLHDKIAEIRVIASISTDPLNALNKLYGKPNKPLASKGFENLLVWSGNKVQISFVTEIQSICIRYIVFGMAAENIKLEKKANDPVNDL